jgi:hypothetical protein
LVVNGRVFGSGFGIIDNQNPPVDNKNDMIMHILGMGCNGQAAMNG